MKIDYKRNFRKWIALLTAIVCYFIIHEGAHLIYALCVGVFKKVNFLALGVQVEVFSDKMINIQLDWFCLVSAIATLTVGYILAALTKRIIKVNSAYFRAIMFYVTLCFLLIDPLYLSVLYSFVGGGDMNGIVFLIPELATRIIFGILASVNVILLFKVIIPQYKRAYMSTTRL